MLRSIVVAVLIGTQIPAALASVRGGVVGGSQDPDWPCVQRKVPQLSAAAVWEGPPIEGAAKQWRDDAEVAAFVEQIAARRMSLEDAEAAIADFGAGLDAAEREARLTLVFAGLFETLDRERSDVIAGIERYGRRQKTLAEQIRIERAQLSELSAAAAAAADAQRAAELQNRLIWETRIFNERRNSLAFVCEVPTLIEQRLFVLARAIQAAINDQ